MLIALEVQDNVTVMVTVIQLQDNVIAIIYIMVVIVLEKFIFAQTTAQDMENVTTLMETVFVNLHMLDLIAVKVD